MKTPIDVKLGSTKYGFYHIDVTKNYTEIQKNKMPWHVLSILNGDIYAREMGLHEITLNNYLLEAMPELAIDKWGNSTTLPSLLRDFHKGKLIEYGYGKKIKITELGKKFLQNNVIEE